MKKRTHIPFFVLLLVSVMTMFISGISVSAASKPFTYPKKMYVEYKKGTSNYYCIPVTPKNRKYYDDVSFMTKCRKNYGKLTSSKKKIVSCAPKAYLNDRASAIKFGPVVKVKKAGTATVKYKVTIGKKTYKCSTRIYVRKYSDPIQKVTVDGNNCTSEISGSINVSDLWLHVETKSSQKSHTISIEPKKGWKVKKMTGYVWSDSGESKFTVTNGKPFSGNDSQVVVVMVNPSTKVEKTLTIDLFKEWS